MSKPPSDIPPPASSSSDVFSDAVSPGRRDFLKLTAAAGATLLGGCLNDDDPQQELGATAASIAKFDHMVVVMFENRSFDGLLGYCYQATDPPPRNQTSMDSQARSTAIRYRRTSTTATPTSRRG